MESTFLALPCSFDGNYGYLSDLNGYDGKSYVTKLIENKIDYIKKYLVLKWIFLINEMIEMNSPSIIYKLDADLENKIDTVQVY